MADYQSTYTGLEIDAGIAKANTAIQPTDLATSSTKGIVQVDGTTITAVDGVISASGGSSNLGEVKISPIPLTDDKLHELDGSLLTGGAYYDYNITEVGTITKSNGTISGFSSGNYAQATSTLNLTTDKTWEFVIKAKRKALSGGDYVFGLFYRQTTPTYKQEEVEITMGNSNIYWYIKAQDVNSISGTLVENYSLDTYYTIKITYALGTYNLYVKNGDDWILITSQNYSALSSNLEINLGVLNSNSQSGFNGIIDLTETYLKVDNELIWTGAEYHSAESVYGDFVNYIADLYEDNPNANYFAQSVPASYEVVGSLTDNNGVVSGFSDNTNYIELPSAFTPSNKNWEIILKLTTPATISGQQTMFTFMDSTQSARVTLYISGNSLYFDMSNIGYLTLVNSLSTSTSYKVKIAYDGSTYKGYIENSGNWSLVDTINDSTALPSVYSGFLGVKSYGTYRTEAFQGSIDLKETSITLDNTTWWEYVPEINDPEQAWQYEVTQHGVCGKFVYDSVNSTVRIPKYGDKLDTTNNTKALDVYYYMTVK